MKARDTRNHAARRKAESLRAIRDRLIAYGHHDQAVEIIKVLSDENKELDALTIARKSKALDAHIKLLQMVVPKPVELSQDPDNPLFEMSADDRFAEYQRVLEAVRRGAGQANTAIASPSATH